MAKEPRYGEIWRISADDSGPTRLGLVVSTDAVARLPWRIIASLTEGAVEGGESGLWQIDTGRIDDGEEASTGPFLVDAARLTTVACAACTELLGRIPSDLMTEVAAAIAILVEAEV